MRNKIKSPRQELSTFCENGDLRGTLEMHPNGLSHGAIELLVNIATRYCERRRRKSKNKK